MAEEGQSSLKSDGRWRPLVLQPLPGLKTLPRLEPHFGKDSPYPVTSLFEIRF